MNRFSAVLRLSCAPSFVQYLNNLDLASAPNHTLGFTTVK